MCATLISLMRVCHVAAYVFPSRASTFDRSPPWSSCSSQAGTNIVHQEFNLLQQLGYEVAILSPIEWIDICQLRCALRQQLWLRQKTTLLAREGTRTAALALGAHQLATAHVNSVPCNFTSEASHVGKATQFVSVLVCSWLNNGRPSMSKKKKIPWL